MQISLPAELKRKLHKKRLIFTVTTGRSGTGYLAMVLRVLPNVASYHEPEPSFVHAMRSVQRDAELAYRFWVETKLPHIAREKLPTYIETSHLFAKGFAGPLLDLGVVPDLIILARPNREVATSLYQLNTIPGRTAKGLTWLLSPEDPGVLPLPGWQDLHSYQLCYWYCLETDRRAAIYEKAFLARGAHVVRVGLDELSTVKGFRGLLEQLDFPTLTFLGWAKYLYLRRQRQNAKADRKMLVDLPVHVAESLEAELLSRMPGQDN